MPFEMSTWSKLNGVIPMNIDELGRIHPPETMFLRVGVGEAEGPNGDKYEMAYSTAGEPIIRSLQSKNWFTLGWSSLIQIAVERGIDQKIEE